MKTYIVMSDTNYELMIHVVNAETAKEAKRIALNAKEMGGGAWPNCQVRELDTTTPGAVFWA